MKNFLLIGAIALMASCGTTKNGTPKTTELTDEARVEKMKAQYPNYSLDNFNKGKELYNNNCNLCHDLPNPTHESDGEWHQIMPKMVELVNKKKPNTIDPAGEDLMLKYVFAMRQK